MKNSRDTIWCNYRVIITAVHSVCCRQTNLAFNQHEGQSVGCCSFLQMRGWCFWVLYQMSPCYFGLCRHMQDVACSQIRSVCLCMIVKGTAHCSSPPWHAQAVSHCVQQSTPWPLCAVAKWSQRRGQSMFVCVCVCLPVLYFRCDDCLWGNPQYKTDASVTFLVTERVQSQGSH